jgi:hypothetical protein
VDRQELVQDLEAQQVGAQKRGHAEGGVANDEERHE